MALLGRDKVDRLLQALSDTHLEVRTAALRALVSLPLQRDAWWAVARQVDSLLDQTPQGDSFEKQTLGGIPYREVIQAAVHIPSTILRQSLAGLLDSQDEDLRFAVMVSLAEAWDTHAIPALLQFLKGSRPRLGVLTRTLRQVRKPQTTAGTGKDPRRVEAARCLSLLDLRGFEEQVTTLIRQEPDPEVRFWVALGLAGAGQLEAFKTALNDLQAGKFYLSDDLDPGPELTGELNRHRDFHGDLTGLIGFLQSANSGIGYDLLQGLLPAGQAEKPSLSGGDPEQAESLAQNLEAHSPYDKPESPFSEEEIQQLRPLAAGAATQLVSTLFSQLAERSDRWGFDNELVQLIYQFDHPFQPDIPALFRIYQRVYQDRPALGWQIAWTVSRAGPEALVAALALNLQSQDETERLAAARLIEEAARYLSQDYPPLFGGGEPPPETLSLEMDWIDLPHAEPPPSPPPDMGMVQPPAPPPPPGGKPRGQKAEPPGRNRPPQRVVNTGFAPEDTPDNLLEPAVPLRAGSAYYFWIDIGAPVAQSGELTPSDIPSIPAETTLTVVLFGHPDGLQVAPEASQGELYLKADGQVIAQSQPLGEHPPGSQYLATRLFFPVRTPSGPGHYTMRCNLYWGQILLQSRLVEADLLASQVEPDGRERYWWSGLDFTLTNRLDPAHMVQLEHSAQETHKLSLFLNDNGDGTNSFYFHSSTLADPIKNPSISFGEGELSAMINEARQNLRWVSWRNTDEWQEGEEYCYKNGQLDLPRLQEDLVKLAVWGHQFFTQVASRLGDRLASELMNKMLTPGYIQIAMKESPNYILPAGMIYDYPLISPDSLCPEFVRNLQAGLPLEDSLCFQGQCPSRESGTAVCPSGFWGFRHELGMPLSVHLAPDVPTSIDYDGSLQLVMGESTDMQLLPEHEPAMQHLQDGVLQVQLYSHRTDIFQGLKKSPHLVYFYCHGGVKNDAPFLQVGPQQNPETILPSNFIDYRVRWNAPRPIVFMNGCHTTAVDPLKAIQFIRPLVEECWCSGVIGTEITIFEELATVFAEEYFRRLLKGETTGKALRGARLKVLSAGNPLGLVYIPFVLGTITLKNTASAAHLDVVPKGTSGTGIEEGDDYVIINGVRVPKQP